MPKPELFLIEPMMPEIEASLDRMYRVHRTFGTTSRMKDATAGAERVRGVVTGGGSGLARELMDALPHLEIIAINGIGTDQVDLAEARARGIRVTTTPDILTDDVADMAIGLMIATMRGLCGGDGFVRAGSWGRNEPPPLTRKVSGKRVGILGFGRVGQAIARRAQAFGMDLAYTDLRTIPGAPFRREPGLVALARWADVLVVAASGGPGSRGIVDASVLDALGPEGFLVNVARGSIVDEVALAASLAERRLGGAGLDVFADEPSVPEALRAMDTVVLQPHRASATIETRRAMGELVLANLAAHFAGLELPTAVV